MTKLQTLLIFMAATVLLTVIMVILTIICSSTGFTYLIPLLVAIDVIGLSVIIAVRHYMYISSEEKQGENKP